MFHEKFFQILILISLSTDVKLINYFYQIWIQTMLHKLTIRSVIIYNNTLNHYLASDFLAHSETNYPTEWTHFFPLFYTFHYNYDFRILFSAEHATISRISLAHITISRYVLCCLVTIQ